ncbi:hypothetical protein B0H10DRAFT_1940596 [Mycena sp. CBHHK59/15]|nr:hypothetical protein B0H10DRAFT_1940596 [Mycena sp. CBHHK59/15]
MDPAVTSSLALTTVTKTPLAPHAKGILLQNHWSAAGPGRTLNEIYSTLGCSAEKYANRAAHGLGLGPNAVAQRIQTFFGDGYHRELKLKELRDNEFPKLEKDSLKLVDHALPWVFAFSSS